MTLSPILDSLKIGLNIIFRSSMRWLPVSVGSLNKLNTFSEIDTDGSGTVDFGEF
jgi:hypothetical protein